MSEQAGHAVGRAQVDLKAGIRSIGLFPVEISLHPEVRAIVTVNIARTPAEGEMQAKTGRAAISADDEEERASQPEQWHAKEEQPDAEEAAASSAA